MVSSWKRFLSRLGWWLLGRGMRKWLWFAHAWVSSYIDEGEREKEEEEMAGCRLPLLFRCCSSLYSAWGEGNER